MRMMMITKPIGILMRIARIRDYICKNFLKGMIRRISIVFVLLILINTAFSQECFKANTIVNEEITYNNLPENGFGRRLFSLIEFENNISVQFIQLQTKSRLLLRVLRETDNKLTAKISLTQVGIESNLNLHGFNVDSILWPSGFTAKLTVNSDQDEPVEIIINGSAYGKLKTIDLTNYLNSNDDIVATISDLQFYYEENKYQQLQNLSETIGYYYSYGRLLTNLIEKHSYNAQSTNLKPEKIFADKIEIDRVCNSVVDYDFTKKLVLDKNDPIGFLKMTKQLGRLSNRAETLFNQQLLNNISNVGVPTEFCELFCEISSNYLREAKTLQPSDASGFIEIAKIEISENAKENLKLVNDYYFEKTNNFVNIGQDIFDKFIALANDNISEDNYTDALLIQINSLIIHNWFNTILTPEYYSSVSFALDGVSASYLRVGNVALRAQNRLLANTYFNKADDIILSNNELFESLQYNDTMFVNYLGLQYDIATQHIDRKMYSNALTSLSLSNVICLKLDESPSCDLIKKAECLAYSGIIDYKLDSLYRLVKTKQNMEAYKRLLIISDYIFDNSCNLKDDSISITKLSYSLAINFLQAGEKLLNEQKTEIALRNLVIAKIIQMDYLSIELDELDRLLQFAAEPEIIKIIEDAKYLTWANKMNEATSLYSKAAELNRKNFAQSNLRINNALDELASQIALRECVSFQNRYDDAIKKVHIAIKYHNYKLLSSLLKEAQFIYDTYPMCNINNEEVLELYDKYKVVLDFYNLYNDIINKLIDGDYQEVIKSYIILIAFYDDNNLAEYPIELSDLKAFVTDNNNLDFTKATAMYCINMDNMDAGFAYLTIYKNQGGMAKNIKHITNYIAREIAFRDEELGKSTKDALREYTMGDSWYNNFRISYLKYRIIN